MKSKILALARIALMGALMLNTVSSVSAKGKGDGGYQTGFTRWRAAEAGFSGWTLNGVTRNAGALTFDAATATTGSDPYAAGTYNGAITTMATRSWWARRPARKSQLRSITKKPSLPGMHLHLLAHGWKSSSALNMVHAGASGMCLASGHPTLPQ